MINNNENVRRIKVSVKATKQERYLMKAYTHTIETLICRTADKIK